MDESNNKAFRTLWKFSQKSLSRYFIWAILEMLVEKQVFSNLDVWNIFQHVLFQINQEKDNE